jgi:hypothetical protein
MTERVYMPARLLNLPKSAEERFKGSTTVCLYFLQGAAQKERVK